MSGPKRTRFESLIVVAPIFLAAIMGIFVIVIRTYERAGYALFAVGIVGVIFIYIAKWPSLKDGRLKKFGTGGMSPASKKKYLVGYVLVSISILGSLILFSIQDPAVDLRRLSPMALPPSPPVSETW